jgi:hypothetical protein
MLKLKSDWICIMKFRHTLAAIVLSVFTSSAADAAVVNFGSPITGGGENIGNVGLVPSSQSGTFFTSPGAGFGLISGSLSSNSKITFSYTFSSANPFEILAASGGTSGTTNFASASSTGFSTSTGSVLASANISGVNGTTSVTNISGGVLSFSSIFIGFLNLVSNGAGGFIGKINYNVSAVPLPASVLMFGAAIVGMFAFAQFSRQRKATSSLA